MINSFSGEYEFLSNFYPCEVVLDNITYPTVEHAYQAAKTEDIAERQKIASLPTPGKAKRAGRKLQLRSDWELRKDGIMLKLLRQKFHNESLCEQLLRTGDRLLVEGNNHNDTYWGVCNGVGINMLGTLLMHVREELKKELGGTQND